MPAKSTEKWHWISATPLWSQTGKQKWIQIIVITYCFCMWNYSNVNFKPILLLKCRSVAFCIIFLFSYIYLFIFIFFAGRFSGLFLYCWSVFVIAGHARPAVTTLNSNLVLYFTSLTFNCQSHTCITFVHWFPHHQGEITSTDRCTPVFSWQPWRITESSMTQSGRIANQLHPMDRHHSCWNGYNELKYCFIGIH